MGNKGAASTDCVIALLIELNFDLMTFNKHL